MIVYELETEDTPAVLYPNVDSVMDAIRAELESDSPTLDEQSRATGAGTRMPYHFEFIVRTKEMSREDFERLPTTDGEAHDAADFLKGVAAHNE